MKKWNFLKNLVGLPILLGAFATVVGYVLFQNASLCLPLLYSDILNTAIEGDVAMATWCLWIGLGILMMAIRHLCSYFNGIYQVQLQRSVVQKLFQWYRSYIHPNAKENGTGYYQNLLVKNTQQMIGLLDIQCLGSLIHTISFFVVTVILFSMDWLCGVVTCLMGVVAILFHRRGNANYSKHGERVQKSKMSLFGDTQDILNGGETILSFGTEGEENERNKVKLEEYQSQEKKMAIFRFVNYFFGLDSCKTLYLLFVMVRSFLLISQGSITMATGATLILYSQLTTNPIQYLNYALVQLQEGLTALKILMDEMENQSSRKAAEIYKGTITQIECRNLSYSYSEKQVLDNLNIRLEMGNCYRLKGDSGKGKTTLLRLLLKELEPQSGEIAVNGRADGSRVEAGVLLQSSTLFHASLEENISFQAKEDDKVKSLVQLMELEHLSQKQIHPDNISGGEMSRVLLARALWCMKDVVILDEPLTGVDMEKRERILPQVVAMLKNKLVLLVTHEEDIARQFPHKELLIG